MNNEEALKDITDTLKDKVEELGDPYPNVWCDTLIKCKEVLEKAEKYRWHDLRKNPNDLPLANEAIAFTKVLIMARQKFYEVATYYKEWNGYTGFYDYRLSANDIIAWREIEPFVDNDNV